MILNFRDELSTRIRIWIRDFYLRSDPDSGKNFPDPKPWFMGRRMTRQGTLAPKAVGQCIWSVKYVLKCFHFSWW